MPEKKNKKQKLVNLCIRRSNDDFCIMETYFMLCLMDQLKSINWLGMVVHSFNPNTWRQKQPQRPHFFWEVQGKQSLNT